MRRDLRFFRVQAFGLSPVFFAVAVALPVGVFCYYWLFAGGALSVSGDDLPRKLAFALKVGISAGITEEVLFRGYIMKLVENRWNKAIAALAPSVLFASGHLFGGMGAADVLLVFVAGTAVGVMFSLIAYARETVGNSIVVHAVWNFLMLGVFGISTHAGKGRILLCAYESDSLLLTGGRFGVESGLPAIVAYLLVIAAVAAVLARRRKASAR